MEKEVFISKKDGEEFINALTNLNIEKINELVKRFGVNALIGDNDCDGLAFSRPRRPLDFIVGRSRIVENWLRLLGGKTQEEMSEMELQSRIDALK